MKNDWQVWNGGECPVEQYVLVDIKMKEGEESFGDSADWWDWEHNDNCGDIVAWRLSEGNVQEVVEEAADKPIISDGGSSSYYSFTITNKAGKSIVVETGDVCRAMVANDFDLSNILKACRRLSEASKGIGKAGASVEYDCNKIGYFSEEYKHWHKEPK